MKVKSKILITLLSILLNPMFKCPVLFYKFEALFKKMNESKFLSSSIHRIIEDKNVYFLWSCFKSNHMMKIKNIYLLYVKPAY